MAKKILLVGGAGFIGRNILESFCSEFSFYVIDNLDPLIHGVDSREIRKFLRSSSEGFLQSDYVSHEALKFVESVSPDVIVTLVSQTGTNDSQNRADWYIGENVEKFARFVQHCARKARDVRFIHLSSRAVYGAGYSQLSDGTVVENGIRTLADLEAGRFKYGWEYRWNGTYLANCESQPSRPASIYGMTKLAQEGVLSSMLPAVDGRFSILRLQNVIGPGQSPLNPYTGLTCWFVNLALEREPIAIFENGEIWRDFIDVRDVASVVMASINSEFKGDIIDVGSGDATNLADYARTVVQVIGSSSEVITSKQFRAGDVRWARANVARLEKYGLPGARRTVLESITDYYSSLLATKR